VTAWGSWSDSNQPPECYGMRACPTSSPCRTPGTPAPHNGAPRSIWVSAATAFDGHRHFSSVCLWPQNSVSRKLENGLAETEQNKILERCRPQCTMNDWNNGYERLLWRQPLPRTTFRGIAVRPAHLVEHALELEEICGIRSHRTAWGSISKSFSQLLSNASATSFSCRHTQRARPFPLCWLLPKNQTGLPTLPRSEPSRCCESPRCIGARRRSNA